MKDPRIERKRIHSLENIVFISIAATMSGANLWDDMEDYGNCKGEWLATVLSGCK